ncbi:hypothetical protein L596_029800 [Steinernema carpocapsae]|uniref:Uncharacterized protein n=1 Tax=Steinernema carpocapsae TaxID=34508 RepID=A0A4V5ZX45_STECR|nr:hypothetical protein L596_029800 [Steinernema carpocapsae]
MLCKPRLEGHFGQYQSPQRSSDQSPLLCCKRNDMTWKNDQNGGRKRKCKESTCERRRGKGQLKIATCT